MLAQLLRRKAQSRPRGAGSSAAVVLAELLRAPADVAQSVVGGIAPQAPGSDGAAPAPEPAAASEKAASEKAAPAKAASEESEPPKPATADQRDEEIRELREQVSALTEAVTLLLKEKTERPE